MFHEAASEDASICMALDLNLLVWDQWPSVVGYVHLSDTVLSFPHFTVSFTVFSVSNYSTGNVKVDLFTIQCYPID